MSTGSYRNQIESSSITTSRGSGVKSSARIGFLQYICQLMNQRTDHLMRKQERSGDHFPSQIQPINSETPIAVTSYNLLRLKY